jgi:hypothetical protein
MNKTFKNGIQLLVLSLLLGITGQYALGQCPDAPCQISFPSGTAVVTNPTNCPARNKGFTYNWTSDHSITANKTSGNGMSCHFAYTGRLSTNDPWPNLNTSNTRIGTLGNGCGAAVFTVSVTATHAPQTIGNWVVVAETVENNGSHGVDIKCFSTVQ